MAGMVAGLAVMLYIKFYTPVAWTWYVVIGTAVTFGVGYAGALLTPAKDKESKFV
jgi:hypothetical protein